MSASTWIEIYASESYLPTTLSRTQLTGEIAFTNICYQTQVAELDDKGFVQIG